MQKGERAGDTPSGVDVIEGKSYLAEQTKKVFFCTCKQTDDPPLCDGSHNKK